MEMTLMITRLDLASSDSGSADLTAVYDRLSALENVYVQSTRFATISSGTSGTVTIPTGATIVLDGFSATTDAIVSKMEGGRPTLSEVYEEGGEVVAATFNASGEYVLSDTPLVYPVGLIYKVRQKFNDFVDTDTDILGDVDFLGLQAITHTLWETGRSGLKEWFGSGNYWSWTPGNPGTWTLLRGGEGYIKYREAYFDANQTLSIAYGEAVYIYIDEFGVLQKSTTHNRDELFERIPIGFFQVDVNGNEFFYRNDHKFDTDTGSRAWIADSFGAAFRSVAGSAVISRYTTGTGGATTDRMVNLSSGTLIDADIRTDFAAFTTGTVTNHTYFDGTNFRRHSLSSQYPMVYNNAGTPTAITTNSRGVYRLFATVDSLNSPNPQFISEMHTAQFGTLGAAQTAIGNGTISNLGGLNPDLAQLGFVVVRNNANGGYVEYVEAQRKTFAQVIGGGGVASTASNVLTDTANFNGVLGAGNTTVQSCLEALDDAVGATRVVSTNQTLLPSDSLILGDTSTGNREFTLPPSSTTPVGKAIRIVNYIANANSCYVFPQAGYTIEGFGTTTSTGLRLPFKASVTLVHLGSEVWRILLTENLPVRTVTATTSNTFQGDELVRLLPSANQTFYVYSNISAGKRLVIYRDKFNGTSHTCTVQDGSGAYINNLASLKLAPGECVTLISGNGEWFVEATTSTLMMQVAPNKATPIDADRFQLQDTAGNNALSYMTYAQLKTALKAYFDTLYTPL